VIGELSQTLANYYEIITGERLEVRPAPAGAVASLPLFLRSLYAFSQARMFGHDCLLAAWLASDENPSPAEYAAHVKAIRERTGREVVLIPADVPSYERNRLVRAAVPFVVPGRQMFLPMFHVDLREHSGLRHYGSEGKFMATTQALLIYHLHRNPALAEAPLRVRAYELGYSPMTMTKVKRELQSAGLCAPERTGRATPIRFLLKGQALWQAAEPRLATPVRRTTWSESLRAGDAALVAGLSALSEVTDLGDDPKPTYAMYRPYRQSQEPGTSTLRGPEDVCIEWWRYNPWKLTRTGHSVDPFSLYLSLRHSPDERVQQALEHLVETFPWSP
jgi:hypothetical protein